MRVTRDQSSTSPWTFEESPTFGMWNGVELSEDNRRMLWVPPGFAHGFLVLSEQADFQYKCTESYSPEDERGIRWDDEI